MLAAMQAGGGTVDPTSVWRHIKKDGTVIYVNIVGHLFSWRGMRHCLALISDVTEKRRLEMERAHAYQEMEARLKDTILVQERNRLARDLHDAVSQTLWSAKLISERLPDTWTQDNRRGQHQFAQLQNLIDSALSEMRTLLLELRPAALEEIALAEALRRLTDVMRIRTGLAITFESDYEDKLPPDAQTALYRITQEAMNNCVRHASCANIHISLMPVNGTVELSVSDDGCGFDVREAKTGHYGLSIMRERAEAVQATFAVESQVGQGTHIRVQYALGATV
jgi:signal transduction histidine kinase